MDCLRRIGLEAASVYYGNGFFGIAWLESNPFRGCTPCYCDKEVTMSDVSACSPDVVSRFFRKYLSCLAKAGVPEKRRRWYVKHIEYFIRAQNGRRIKTLTADDINHYFDVPGRQNQL